MAATGGSGVSEGPRRIVPELSIAMRQAALRARFPVWEPLRLDQLLDRMAAEFPDRPLLITDTRTWTYAEVRDWSVQVAAGLIASGVRPGDHVGLLMANHPEFVAIKFGIARAGAVAVPINFLNRQHEIGYVLGQSDAVFLFTMDRFRDLDYLGFLDGLAPGWETAAGGSHFPRLRTIVVLPSAGAPSRPGVPTFDAFCRSAGPLPAIDHPGPASNSTIIYTSGTTGRP
ncbi:MAG: AMP-binding protein, partial [Alsobacter sp.]